MDDLAAVVSIAISLGVDGGMAGAVVIAIASILDALLPIPHRGSPWTRSRRALSRFACNVRHARNAKTPIS